MKTVNEMAIEAWGAGHEIFWFDDDGIERFAALVADAEAKRIYDEGMVTVGHMRDQIAAEREACAKVCEKLAETEWADNGRCAAAIRARGQA